jgi:hypothetical protein
MLSYQYKSQRTESDSVRNNKPRELGHWKPAYKALIGQKGGESKAGDCISPSCFSGMDWDNY